MAIIMDGSPLFTGDAGGGESEIRRFILENDWLEALIALPEQLFYSTGIATYVWVITNRKARSAGTTSSSLTPRRSGCRCARAWGTSAAGAKGQAEGRVQQEAMRRLLRTLPGTLFKDGDEFESVLKAEPQQG